MHPYQKPPPAFAKDPWAWDYTRTRMEQNTGLDYPDWQGKHFAGAAAMYKNVVKKYRAGVDQQMYDIPRECVNCGVTTKHYQGDYICSDCRDRAEQATTIQEAEAIQTASSMDDLREQLAKALGHDKKDAKKARSTDASKEVRDGKLVYSSDQSEVFSGPTGTRGPSKVSRNYGAMGHDKLVRSIRELDAGDGEAMRKVKAGEDPMDHLEAALRAAQERGITV